MNKQQAINILLDYANKKEVSNDVLENDRDRNKVDNKVEVKGVELALRKGS